MSETAASFSVVLHNQATRTFGTGRHVARIVANNARGTRAHANCIENLPVFGAIVYLVSAIGLQGPVVDALCIAVLAARVVQSCVHIAHEQTNAFVAVRFSFYSVQLVAFLLLIVMVARRAVEAGMTA